jgi:hypothetical protein
MDFEKRYSARHAGEIGGENREARVGRRLSDVSGGKTVPQRLVVGVGGMGGKWVTPLVLLHPVLSLE